MTDQERKARIEAAAIVLLSGLLAGHLGPAIANGHPNADVYIESCVQMATKIVDRVNR
jgi:hypothetical protein